MLSNANIAWLAFARQVSPVSLVVFSFCEILLLILVMRAELIPIPKALRGPERQSTSVFVWVFVLVYLVITNGTVGIVDIDNLQMLLVAHDLQALTRLHVLQPLLLSAVFATIAVAGDWALWRRNSGIFVSAMTLSIIPKLFLLFFAPLLALSAAAAVADFNGEDIETSSAARFAWCITYLAIKCVMEIGVLVLWQKALTETDKIAEGATLPREVA